MNSLKPSFYSPKDYLISTGIPDLDTLYGGGMKMQTLNCFDYPSHWTRDALIFSKLFLSQGPAFNDICINIGPPIKLIYVNPNFVQNTQKQKQPIPSSNNSISLDISWQYKKYDKSTSFSKKTHISASCTKMYCHPFDYNKTTSYDKLINIPLTFEIQWETLLNSFLTKLSSVRKQNPRSPVRLILGPYQSMNPLQFLVFANAVVHILKDSKIQFCAVILMNSSLLKSTVSHFFSQLVDSHIKLFPFHLYNIENEHFKKYSGVLRLVKPYLYGENLPIPQNSLVGMSGWYLYKMKANFLSIEEIYLPPEFQDVLTKQSKNYIASDSDSSSTIEW